MKLITVRCARPHDAADNEPRIAVTIAPDPSEAEDVCRTAYGGEGYTLFYTDDVIEGHFAGPPRVLGYIGRPLGLQLEAVKAS